MESLLNTAALPLPSVIDQHNDLPQVLKVFCIYIILQYNASVLFIWIFFLETQVHAINILKALYQEASLGPSVLQYASKGTIMAVSGFASSSWAVRNASMQLFGKRFTLSLLEWMMEFCKVALTFMSVDKPMVWPFKWNLFGSTFMGCYLFLKVLRKEIWDFCWICFWSHLAVKGLIQYIQWSPKTGAN